MSGSGLNKRKCVEASTGTIVSNDIADINRLSTDSDMAKAKSRKELSTKAKAVSAAQRKKEREEDDLIMDYLLWGAMAAALALAIALAMGLHWFLLSDARGQAILVDILTRIGYLKETTYQDYGGGRNNQQQQQYQQHEYRQEHSYQHDDSTFSFPTSNQYIPDDSHFSNQVNGACSFVCPKTHVCVSNPKDCPCPFARDVRCDTHDWFVCLKAGEKCAAVGL
eukprot:CFRG6839T1